MSRKRKHVREHDRAKGKPRAAPEPEASPTASSPPGRWRLGPTTALLLLALAATGSLSRSCQAVSAGAGIDFYHFWLVPQAIEHGEQIYDHQARVRLTARFAELARQSGSQRLQRAATVRRVIDPNGSPVLYASLAPLVRGDYDQALARFRAIGLALFVAAIIGLCWMLGYSLVEALAAVVALTLLSDPFLVDVKVANVNGIQVAALTLALWLQRPEAARPWRLLLAGAVVAWAGLFKANIAVGVFAVGLLWVFDRQWRKLGLVVGGGALGGLVAVAIADSLFGRLDVWIDWATSLGIVMTKVSTAPGAGNSGLHRALGGGVPVWLLVALSAGIMAVALWWGRARGRTVGAAGEPGREGRLRAEVLALSAGLAAGLLFSRVAWSHYFNLLTPGILASLKPGIEATGSPRALRLRLAVAVTATACLMATPLHPLIGGRAEVGSAVGIAGVVLLFGLNLYELARWRAAPAG